MRISECLLETRKDKNGCDVEMSLSCASMYGSVAWGEVDDRVLSFKVSLLFSLLGIKGDTLEGIEFDTLEGILCDTLEGGLSHSKQSFWMAIELAFWEVFFEILMIFLFLSCFRSLVALCLAIPRAFASWIVGIWV